MTKFKSGYIWSGVLVLLALGLIIQLGSRPAPNYTACTEEALLCPDGSAVGRTAPDCSFAACPNNPAGYFTGQLRLDGDNYHLIIAAPANLTRTATYALPLTLEAGIDVNQFINRQVKATGSFVSGHTYHVRHLALISDDTGVGDNEAVISLGETKLISGVKITPHTITADSRCPVDVTCITAGAVTARVTLLSDTDQEVTELTSGTAPHPFDAWQIFLLKVEPNRVVSHAPESASYRLTFRVDPLPDNQF